MLNLKELLEKILGCVYEQDTDGVWTWKKYNDGTFDMWRSYNGAPTTGTHYAQTYNLCGYRVEGFTYPSDCKPISTGNIQVYAEWNIGGGFAVPCGTVFSPTLTGFNLYAKGSSANISSVQIDIYVHGYWK